MDNSTASEIQSSPPAGLDMNGRCSGELRTYLVVPFAHQHHNYRTMTNIHSLIKLRLPAGKKLQLTTVHNLRFSAGVCPNKILGACLCDEGISKRVQFYLHRSQWGCVHGGVGGVLRLCDSYRRVGAQLLAAHARTWRRGQRSGSDGPGPANTPEGEPFYF